jgi:hypothetical protein
MPWIVRLRPILHSRAASLAGSTTRCSWMPTLPSRGRVGQTSPAVAWLSSRTASPPRATSSSGPSKRHARWICSIQSAWPVQLLPESRRCRPCWLPSWPQESPCPPSSRVGVDRGKGWSIWRGRGTSGFASSDFGQRSGTSGRSHLESSGAGSTSSSGSAETNQIRKRRSVARSPRLRSDASRWLEMATDPRRACSARGCAASQSVRSSTIAAPMPPPTQSVASP